jgi:hypothetical protein
MNQPPTWQKRRCRYLHGGCAVRVTSPQGCFAASLASAANLVRARLNLSYQELPIQLEEPAAVEQPIDCTELTISPTGQRSIGDSPGLTAATDIDCEVTSWS